MKDIFLVDADDTVLDFHGASALALRAAFAGQGVMWKEEYLTVFREVNDGLWSALERKELTRAELLRTRFPNYLQALDLHLDSEAFNGAYLEYLATHPHYIDGAEAFLSALNKMGSVYIVTNGTERIQQSRFSRCGLYAYAKDVFISERIGYNKPAGEYTQYVLSHIPNFSVERAVWIGDSLNADIRAANEAGITSVWLNRTGKPRESGIIPDYEADNLQKILMILQRICVDNSNFPFQNI